MTKTKIVNLHRLHVGILVKVLTRVKYRISPTGLNKILNKLVLSYILIFKFATALRPEKQSQKLATTMPVVKRLKICDREALVTQLQILRPLRFPGSKLSTTPSSETGFFGRKSDRKIH